jgi:hypothetical protein
MVELELGQIENSMVDKREASGSMDYSFIHCNTIGAAQQGLRNITHGLDWVHIRDSQMEACRVGGEGFLR